MSSYILAIDQGTTGTTVVLVDASGRAVDKVNHEFPQIFPKPGWVEHNLEDIWGTVVQGIEKLFRKTGIDPKSIVAVGITNQRETVGIWEKSSGKPIANAIVWQCRRTTDRCNKIKKNTAKKRAIMKKTGLVVDPYFSGSKIEWLLKNVSGAKAKAKAGKVVAGNIDTYLIWKLSGGQSHVTDVSNASRTMLMDLAKGDWDPMLMKTFGVPRNILPEILPSSGEFGVTKGVPGLPDGIPISGVAGDQQAALFGQTCFKEGESKCTFGTGSFILMNTGSKVVRSRSGLLTTVAWQLKGDKKLTYALEGGAFVCGAAVQWLRDGLGMIHSSSEIEALAGQVDDNGGVQFVPALTGLGAPYWNAEARGLITGLTRGATKNHIARATLEAMALQNVDILTAMQKDLKKPMKELRVDGGAAANNLLMQLQADYLGKTVLRPELIETTVAGAAYLAGLGVGFWKSTSDIKNVWAIEQEFKSRMKPAARRNRLTDWKKAVERAL